MHPRFRSLVAAAAAAALLLGACAGSSEDASAAATPDILAVEDVIGDGIEIVPDPSGTSAVLKVTSDLPLACAVVYGTADSFGLIATDDDMGGAAHTDHSAQMRGLAPDTTYRYRLQGSDPAGNFYASQVMEFTTPSARAVERPGENVAPEASVAAVSSEFSDAFAAANAIDGDPSTDWSSAGDGDDASLTVDLGKATDLVGVGVRSRSMGDGSAIIETFSITLDDGEALGPFEVGTEELSIQELTGSASTVRFDAVTSTGGNTGLIDLEIYRAG